MAKSARTENLGGVVRGGELYRGKQGLDYSPGVSAETRRRSLSSSATATEYCIQ